jgi:hypothetical protein
MDKSSIPERVSLGSEYDLGRRKFTHVVPHRLSVRDERYLRYLWAMKPALKTRIIKDSIWYLKHGGCSEGAD